MKKLENFEDVDLEKLIGKEIKCIELVTNDENEYSIEIFMLEEKDNQKTICEELNRYNNDKHCKYIAINYEVQEDLSLMAYCTS